MQLHLREVPSKHTLFLIKVMVRQWKYVSLTLYSVLFFKVDADILVDS